MKNFLLRQYLQMFIETTQLARVPTQLISPEGSKTAGNEEQDEEIEEFSAAAGAAGYTLPCGTNPADIRTRRKRN